MLLLRLLRWSLALHLVLLSWIASALQVIEGKIHTAAALHSHHRFTEKHSWSRSSGGEHDALNKLALSQQVQMFHLLKLQLVFEDSLSS